jgi:hypothetical protein
MEKDVYTMPLYTFFYIEFVVPVCESRIRIALLFSSVWANLHAYFTVLMKRLFVIIPTMLLCLYALASVAGDGLNYFLRISITVTAYLKIEYMRLHRIRTVISGWLPKMVLCGLTP